MKAPGPILQDASDLSTNAHGLLQRWFPRVFGHAEHDALAKIRRMSREEAIAAIDDYFWWHSIDLGGGVTTPGIKSPALMAIEFENTFSGVDLTGKSALDIGAWNGGFAVEAVRRGAERVVALDHYTWNHERFKGRETFELVCRATGMSIDTVDVDLDSSPLILSHLGQFDVVLFLGVFYHLIDPIAALRQIVPLVRETLVLETHIEHTVDQRPLMILYPGSELAGDPTNWWGPNTACIVQILQLAGFAQIDVATGSDPNRQIFRARRTRDNNG